MGSLSYILIALAMGNRVACDYNELSHWPVQHVILSMIAA